MNVDIIVTSNNNPDYNPQFLKDYLPLWNFNISPLCYEQKSTDDAKLANIQSALTSYSDVIVAMRGGSGATRLMSNLRNVPKLEKPKTFVGYSDLTVLLNYLNQDPLMTCIHGPMAFELTTEKRIEKFKSALVRSDVKFEKPGTWLTAGELEGQVVGGNLLLIINSIGTFYEPNFEQKILLIEEIDEPIDKLDRMFAQLRDSGILTSIKGLILGNFKNCASQDELTALFELYFGNLNIPVLYNLNIGHIDDSDYIHLHSNLRIDETGITYL